MLKNIVKTLEANKAEIAKQFEQLNQRRQNLQTTLVQISEELARLQGENRRIDKLLNDFQDEPKDKSNK